MNYLSYDSIHFTFKIIVIKGVTAASNQGVQCDTKREDVGLLTKIKLAVTSN